MSCHRKALIIACLSNAAHAVLNPVKGKVRASGDCFFQRLRTSAASVFSGMCRVWLDLVLEPSMVIVLFTRSTADHSSERSSPRRIPVFRLNKTAGSRWSANSPSFGRRILRRVRRQLFAVSRSSRIFASRARNAFRKRSASAALKYRTFGLRSRRGTSTFRMTFAVIFSSLTARLSTPDIVARSRVIVDGFRPSLKRSSFQVSNI